MLYVTQSHGMQTCGSDLPSIFFFFFFFFLRAVRITTKIKGANNKSGQFERKRERGGERQRDRDRETERDRERQRELELENFILQGL